MPAFSWQALDPAGRTRRGTLQGDSARAVRALLREQGLNPLAVDELQPGAGARPGRGFGSAGLALLMRQLAALAGAGLPLDEALEALAAQAGGERQRAAVLALRARVMEGAGLAQAMAEQPQLFPELFHASVAAGEQSGRLAEVLERLADHAEARDALRQRVLAALAYPLLLAAVAIAVVAGLLAWVVPQVVGVFGSLGQELPLATRVLIGLSDALRRFGVVWLLALAGIVIGVRLLLRQDGPRRRWHRLVLRLPLAGQLVRAAETARATRTLALLAGSAVPLLDALSVAAKVVANRPMRAALEQAAVEVREGRGFSQALAEGGLFPPVALRLVASGERSGELARMLGEAAAQQQRELDRWLGLLTAVLGPAIILVVGAMVLFIVLAILLPVFELNQMVR